MDEAALDAQNEVEVVEQYEISDDEADEFDYDAVEAPDDEEDDGTLQVHECVADPVRAQAEVNMETFVLSKVGTVPEEAEELNWSSKGLDDKDAAAIADWLKYHPKLKALKCAAL